MVSFVALAFRRASQDCGGRGPQSELIELNKKPKHQSSVICIERKLLKSEAWWALTGAAPQVMTGFLVRRQFNEVRSPGGRRSSWVIINNGQIEFTYAEAKGKYGVTNPRFTRAIDQLVEVGFIDIAKQGGGMLKNKTLYAISDRWEKFGTEEFKHVERQKDMRQMGYRNRPKKKDNI